MAAIKSIKSISNSNICKKQTVLHIRFIIYNSLKYNSPTMKKFNMAAKIQDGCHSDANGKVHYIDVREVVILEARYTKQPCDMQQLITQAPASVHIGLHRLCQLIIYLRIQDGRQFKMATIKLPKCIKIYNHLVSHVLSACLKCKTRDTIVPIN